MQLFPGFFATFASFSLRPLRLEALAFTVCQAKSLIAKDAKKNSQRSRRRTTDKAGIIGVSSTFVLLCCSTPPANLTQPWSTQRRARFKPTNC